MLVTAPPSAQVTTTITATTTSLPLSFSMTSPSDIQFKDYTLGDTVCAQEWIARELGRVQKNTKPRHCHNYEALLQVIDDMSRFLQAPGTVSASAAAAAAAATAIVVGTTVPSQQQIPVLRLVDLEHAWIRIIRYSQRYDADRHQSHPSRLVLALDDMISRRRQLDTGKMEDTADAQHRLFSILFGQVQLTSQLVEPWKMICQWAKQLAHAQDWHVWMGYGLDTFVKAKQRCHLRVEAGTIVTTTSGASSSTSSSPTTSDSSNSTPISTTSTKDHHIMLEQLQGLLLTNSDSTVATSSTSSSNNNSSPLIQKYSS